MALPTKNVDVTAHARTAFVIPPCVGCGGEAVQSGLAQAPAEAVLLKQKLFELRVAPNGTKRAVQKHWCCKACWDADPEVIALREDAAERKAERAEVAVDDLPF